MIYRISTTYKSVRRCYKAIKCQSYVIYKPVITCYNTIHGMIKPIYNHLYSNEYSSSILGSWNSRWVSEFFSHQHGGSLWHVMAPFMTSIQQWYRYCLGEACSGQGGPETDNTPPRPLEFHRYDQGKIWDAMKKYPWGYHIFFWSISGWWLSPTPMKNDGVRQLGLWSPRYGKSWNSMVPHHQAVYIDISPILTHGI